jgi:hypothetical protein
MSKEEHRLALSMHPYALVHAGFQAQPADGEIVREIKDSGVYVSTTLAISKMMLLMWDQEALANPWIKMLVPEAQLATARDSRIRNRVIEEVVLDGKPKWAPAFVAKAASRFFLNKSIVQTQLSNSMKSVQLMQAADVPLVMGSDSGNWPVWTTFFHGVGSILEIEALRDCGLTAGEVITVSTWRAAKMLKIDDKVGRVAEGMIADLVILNENPMISRTAFRKVDYVIKDGVAKRPIDWLR